VGSAVSAGTRVDFVVNSLGIGGAERHTLDLADAFIARGFAVRTVALAVTDDARLPKHTPATATAVQLRHRRAADLGALRAYRALVRSDPPDVTVAVNQYPLAFVCAARVLARQAPLLLVMHTIELPHEDSPLKRWLYPRLMRQPSAIAYVCELQRQHWRRAGIVAQPDHCVHNGVDVERFREPPGLGPGDFVVGLCAVLRPEKRHDLLLQALAIAWARGEPVHALLIGDGPERERVTTLARSLGVEHAVHITGYQRDVVPFIAACDAMCLVSDHEAFSLSILESMAMARPVVATRTGGVQEQITDGIDGLLVPCGDAAALAAAFERLRDPALCQEIGQRAATIVRARFSQHRMVDGYVGIVRALAQPAGRTRPAT
jgi:L-malate glycosyltransferase